jgi:hypothetical protein
MLVACGLDTDARMVKEILVSGQTYGYVPFPPSFSIGEDYIIT